MKVQKYTFEETIDGYHYEATPHNDTHCNIEIPVSARIALPGLTNFTNCCL